jgi:single-strand DNA-binding protein
MANDYNHFCFIGHLTRDAELKYTSGGTAVANFSIAVNKRVSKDKDMVSYFDIELWGNYATALEKYLHKGQQIQVAGEVKQQRWQDKASGNARSKIIFTAKDLQLLGGGGKRENKTDNQETYNDPYKDDAENHGVGDDGIPF